MSSRGSSTATEINPENGEKKVRLTRKGNNSNNSNNSGVVNNSRLGLENSDSGPRQVCRRRQQSLSYEATDASSSAAAAPTQPFTPVASPARPNSNHQQHPDLPTSVTPGDSDGLDINNFREDTHSAAKSSKTKTASSQTSNFGPSFPEQHSFSLAKKSAHSSLMPKTTRASPHFNTHSDARQPYNGHNRTNSKAKAGTTSTVDDEHQKSLDAAQALRALFSSSSNILVKEEESQDTSSTERNPFRLDDDDRDDDDDNSEALVTGETLPSDTDSPLPPTTKVLPSRSYEPRFLRPALHPPLLSPTYRPACTERTSALLIRDFPCSTTLTTTPNPPCSGHDKNTPDREQRSALSRTSTIVSTTSSSSLSRDGFPEGEEGEKTHDGGMDAKTGSETRSLFAAVKNDSLLRPSSSHGAAQSDEERVPPCCPPSPPPASMTRPKHQHNPNLSFHPNLTVLTSSHTNPVSTRQSKARKETPPIAEKTTVEGESPVTPQGTKSNSSTKYSRKDKSLGLLCENFMSQFRDMPPFGSPPRSSNASTISEEDHSNQPTRKRDIAGSGYRYANDPTTGLEASCIEIDAAAKHLGVERRRIYDIINILEAIRVVSRLRKNTYRWHGMGGLEETFRVMQKEAVVLWEDDARKNGLIAEGTKTRNGSPKSKPQPATESTAVDTLVAAAKQIDGRDGIFVEARRLSDSDTSSNLFKPLSSILSTTQKEKSLGRLSQKFIQLFLVGYDCVSLTDASDKILGSDGPHFQQQPEKNSTSVNLNTDVAVVVGGRPKKCSKKLSGKTGGDGNVATTKRRRVSSETNIISAAPISNEAAREVARGLKTKIRRLYDIANVMVSIGVVEKVNNNNCGSIGTSKCKPSFRWIFAISPKQLFYGKSHRTNELSSSSFLSGMLLQKDPHTATPSSSSFTPGSPLNISTTDSGQVLLGGSNQHAKTKNNKYGTTMGWCEPSAAVIPVTPINRQQDHEEAADEKIWVSNCSQQRHYYLGGVPVTPRKLICDEDYGPDGSVVEPRTKKRKKGSHLENF